MYLHHMVVQHLKQAVDQLGQIDDHVDLRHCIQRRHPRDDKLSGERVLREDSFAQQRNEGVQVERLRILCYNVLTYVNEKC